MRQVATMGLRAFVSVLLANLGLTGCQPRNRFATPVETMQSLRNAIERKNWAAAGECFTDEMRQRHRDAISTERFYKTDYWMSSVTFHNMFAPILILSPSADFEIAQQDPEQARVRVRYSDPRDKDIRVRNVELVRDAAGNWKIRELYPHAEQGGK